MALVRPARRVRIGVADQVNLTPGPCVMMRSRFLGLRSDRMPSVDHGSTSHTVITAVEVEPTVPVVCPGGFDFTGVEALRFG